jgi:hypothetical protein
MLVQLHNQIVGNKIIEYLYSTYPSTALPNNSTKLVGNDGILTDENAIVFTKYMQLVLNLFSINNYALDMKVNLVESDSKNRKNEYIVKVKSVLPVTLWSSHALANRRDVPTNIFELKALTALAAIFSIKIDVVDTIFDEISVIHILKVAGKKGKSEDKSVIQYLYSCGLYSMLSGSKTSSGCLSISLLVINAALFR